MLGNVRRMHLRDKLSLNEIAKLRENRVIPNAQVQYSPRRAFARRVSDATYRQMLDLLGHVLMVNLTGLLGTRRWSP
ncbi:hypothetical protein NX786_17915 [Telluria mixta]|uniref:Uncharacterized protein n=1 Tax=Telluria mixta TaxID=34071 RepID=A0ABT2C1G8_9BURK|nr:hypothetical protein [Telluria mixta]MCS0631214.1 hypothetical protein [Telluria mixta]WEM95753.1 hypothetical protein P0M04_30510 [Telluria mixta]